VSQALYARHSELLSGLGRRALRIVALDSVEVALGAVATVSARPGLAAEPLDELWNLAGRAWAPSFGRRLRSVAGLVRDHVPDDTEGAELDDLPELLALAAGVVVTLAEGDGSWADRVDEAAGILVDVHQHVDAMVAGDDMPLLTGPRRAEDMPPPTPLEGYCVQRQIEVFTLLAAGSGPAAVRSLSQRGRAHLAGVVAAVVEPGW
jgi:hypothetical protein